MKNIIQNLEKEGYTTNFSLEEDCLYCAYTHQMYKPEELVIDKTIAVPATIPGDVPKTVVAVSLPTYNAKGYYIY
jgi:hypothetical protein